MAAYVIAESRHAPSPEASKYRELAEASIVQYGGRYLARGVIPDALEGTWPSANRMVIIEFPSMDQAKRWYSSPEYAHARSARSDLDGRRLLFVPGLGQ